MSRGDARPVTPSPERRCPPPSAPGPNRGRGVAATPLDARPYCHRRAGRALRTWLQKTLTNGRCGGRAPPPHRPRSRRLARAGRGRLPRTGLALGARLSCRSGRPTGRASVPGGGCLSCGLANTCDEILGQLGSTRLRLVHDLLRLARERIAPQQCVQRRPGSGKEQPTRRPTQPCAGASPVRRRPRPRAVPRSRSPALKTCEYQPFCDPLVVAQPSSDSFHVR